MIVAAFDFDGTLTRRDTMFPFLLHVAGGLNFCRKLGAVSPQLGLYLLGRLDNQSAKERVLTAFLKGLTRSEIEKMGTAFADTKVGPMLRTEAVEKLRWHQLQGHHCVLLSASLDVYVSRWAETMGFRGVACSSLEYDSDGRATGFLRGKNCYGAEKVRRLRQLFQGRTISELFAYGDSRGDKELMAMANHAFYRQFAK